MTMIKTGPAHPLTGSTMPSRFSGGGICLLCDEYIVQGQLIGQVKRFGWVHAQCADQGNLPPTATAECGGRTVKGYACHLAVKPGGRCKYHRDQT